MATSSSAPLRKILFAVLLMGGQSYAQPQAAAVEGTVFDATQAIFPDAHVIAINLSSFEVRQAQTSTNGQYRIDDLVPGRYQIVVGRTCFNPKLLRIALKSGETKRISPKLSPAKDC